MNDSSPLRHRCWRIGELIVDEPSLQIRQGDRILTTEAAQVTTLIALIEVWPEIIDKNRLIERVWGQRVVSDAAVHKTISLLRRQLREAQAEDVIETRHRLGYRLTRAPELMASEAQQAAPVAPPARRSWLGPGIGVLALVLILAVVLLWPESAPEPVLEPSAAATTVAEEDFDELLSERDLESLLALIQTSLPSDLEMAEQALQEATTRSDAGQVDAESTAMIQKYYGILYFYRSEFQQAIDRWLLALDGFEQIGNDQETANVLTNLGAAHEERDAPAQTIADFYDRALVLQRGLGDPDGRARTLNNLATLWVGRGQVERAQSALAELRSDSDIMTQPAWQVRASLLAGDIDALTLGVDPVPAFRRAHEQATRHGRLLDAAIAAQRLARIFGERGDWELQLDWLDRARRHLQAGGLSARLPIIDYALGLNHERRADPDQARLAYQAVLDQLPEGESIHLAVDAEVALARLEFQAGEVEPARARIQQALRLARIHNHPMAEVSALLAGGFMDLAEPDGTAAAFGAVADIRERLEGDVPFGIQLHLLRLEALALVGNGRSGEAREVIAGLRELSQRRNHQASVQDSRLIDAIALFSEGRFDLGWRAHQSALGQALVPLPLEEGLAVPIQDPPPPEPVLPVWWWAVPLVLMSFAAGWLLSSRRRIDPRRSGQ